MNLELPMCLLDWIDKNKLAWNQLSSQLSNNLNELKWVLLLKLQDALLISI